MRKLLSTALAAGILSLGGSTYAQTNINIDFEDGTTGGLVETGRITGLVGDPTVGDGVITFLGLDGGGSENGARIILGTEETNVLSASFVASVDILYTDAGQNNAFFGVGRGETDGNSGGGSFGEPTEGPAVFGIFGVANNFFGDISDFQTSTIASQNDAGLAVNPNYDPNDVDSVEFPKLVFADTEATGVFTTVTLTFDADAQTLVFSSPSGSSNVISLGETETTDPVTGDVITNPANGFDDTNSRLFIGGSANVKFDNLTLTYGGGMDIEGDFNGDGSVDLSDLDEYIGNLNQPATGDLARLDLNGDDTVDSADFERHYGELVETATGVKGTLAGDANLDGTVSVVGDATALIANLGSAATSWSQGDFNGDGNVTVVGDATALIGNLGSSNNAAASAATSAVPEPGSLSLLALAGLTAVARRRR